MSSKPRGVDVHNISRFFVYSLNYKKAQLIAPYCIVRLFFFFVSNI